MPLPISSSEDLPDLIAQRDEIERRITAAQQDAADEFNDALDALHAALTAYLASTGLPFCERERKVVLIIDVDNRVTVEFGAKRGEYHGYLAVRYGNGGRGEFHRQLPPPAALIGFVRGLLEDSEAES